MHQLSSVGFEPEPHKSMKLVFMSASIQRPRPA